MRAREVFDVVCDSDERFALWPTDRALPPGWSRTGFSGEREDCLNHLEKTWTDLRPAGLRAWLSTTDSVRTGPSPTDVVYRIAEMAATNPHQVAVRDTTGSMLTYAELVVWSGRVAQSLREQGIGAEDRVGVIAHRTVGTIANLLGVLWAGAAYVPIDPAAPAARTAVIAGRAGLRTTLDGTDPRGDAMAEPTPAHQNSLAYVLFTSGSTGVPKGVMVERAAMSWFVNTAREKFNVTAADTFLHFSSLGFDTSVFEVFTALTAGATLVVAGSEHRRDVSALSTLLREASVTAADLPPSVLDLIEPTDVPRLRIAFSGGEPCPPALANRWASAHAPLWYFYGPTEATVAATVRRCDRPRDTRLPLGEALEGAALAVLDGELYLGGEGVARGYLDDPRGTALAFGPHPLGTKPGRWYRTGDLVRTDDAGELAFVGRRDRQLKVRGVRIEPAEVEDGLRADPRVRQAFVTKAPEREQLIAYVVSTPGTLATELRLTAAEVLPPALVPDEVVVVDALPRTVNDKIDEAALHALRAAPQSGLDGFSELEAQVAIDLFQPRIGQVPAVDDSFFDLGGNSLELIKLLSAIRNQYGVHLGLAAFVAEPTVRGVARAVTVGRQARS